MPKHSLFSDSPKAAATPGIFYLLCQFDILQTVEQSILWSFLHPVVTSWSIMAVRAQVDKTKQRKLNFWVLEFMTNASIMYM